MADRRTRVVDNDDPTMEDRDDPVRPTTADAAMFGLSKQDIKSTRKIDSLYNKRKGIGGSAVCMMVLFMVGLALILVPALNVQFAGSETSLLFFEHDHIMTRDGWTKPRG